MSGAPGTVAILGAGRIGTGWAARFALMGWSVRVFDPDARTGPRLDEGLARARASLPALYDVALPPTGPVSRVAAISDAVADAEWIMESAPDRLSLKRKLYQKVQEHCAPDAVIASSSAVLGVSELQGCATRPGQILRLCPVDPVHLIPQVVLEVGDQTDPAVIARATQMLAGLGMGPCDGAPGVALAALAGGCDDTLVSMLRALKTRAAAVAAPILAHEAALAPPPPDPDLPVAPATLARQVPVTWGDYNGHMNEARYVTAFSKAADRLLLWAGMDADAIAAGYSVFTVETHVRYLAEVRIGDPIRVTTRVLDGGGRKFHIWHDLFVADRLCATGEQLLLHVDLATRRSCLPPAATAAWLARAAVAHARLPMPDGLGRHVGQRA